MHVSDVLLTVWIPDKPTVWKRLDEKTVLFKLPAGMRFRPSEGNAHLALDVTFDEPRFGLPNKPAIQSLRAFGARVTEIIKLFDTP